MDPGRFGGEVAGSGALTRETVRMTYSGVHFRPLQGLHTGLAPCTVCDPPWHLGQGISNQHRVGVRPVMRGGQCEQAPEDRQSSTSCRCGEWHRDVRGCSDRCTRDRYVPLPGHQLSDDPERSGRPRGQGRDGHQGVHAAVHGWRRHGSGFDRCRCSCGRRRVRASVTPSGRCLIEHVITKGRSGRFHRPLLRVGTPVGEVEL